MGLDLESFFSLYPWFLDFTISLAKFLILLAIAFQIPPFVIWLERRIPALMQRRRGPNRVGLFSWRLWGLLQSFADAIKLIFKEESVPATAHKTFFQLAPVLGLFPALLVLSAIPFGPPIVLFDKQISLQVISLNIGFLFIIAISSLAVYSTALAGWAANNKFSQLASLRASAQMVSYEIPMGLSLIPMVIIYDSLNLNQIITAQASLSHWGVLLSPLSFLIFLVCMFAETNRAPFDLAEAESELVAGFHTEFGSAKFALFFLTEYINMFALSCLASIFFFGGWQIPFISQAKLVQLTGSTNLAALCGVFSLFIKAAFFMFFYIWVRWTLPRFRYDQLMKLGWQFMLPLGLLNIVVIAFIYTSSFQG